MGPAPRPFDASYILLIVTFISFYPGAVGNSGGGLSSSNSNSSKNSSGDQDDGDGDNSPPPQLGNGHNTNMSDPYGHHQGQHLGQRGGSGGGGQEQHELNNECKPLDGQLIHSSMDSHQAHQLHGLYPRALVDNSMASLHHQTNLSGHPSMHHLLASQLKVDPHFNPSHHPFSINSIIAASSAEAASKAAADMKLYEMGYSAGGYPSSLSPLGPEHASNPNGNSAASYYHHHHQAATAASIYHTAPI